MTATLIIGAGHAGSQFAVSLRAEGYEGDIVLINNDAVVPYHKPPLSKKFIRSADAEATPLRADSAYTKANIQWVHETVSGLNVEDHEVTFDDGTNLKYDLLVMATGAVNRELPSIANDANVFSLRTLTDASELRTKVNDSNRIAVIGGGFIGLEVAACLNELGKSVTVIEAADRLLGRVVAEPISAKIYHALSEAGVKVKLNCQTSEFMSSNENVTSIALANGSKLDVDVVLVGIGAVPNTQLAMDAGVACENGIVVNQQLQTSAKDVYAIGDCAQFPHWQTGTNLRLESVQNAVDQAKCLAKNLASGATTDYKTVPWFWSDIGAMKLQIAGVHAGNTQKVLRDDELGLALYHLKDGCVVCVETLNNAKDHMLARKLIAQNASVSEASIQAGVEAIKAEVGL